MKAEHLFSIRATYFTIGSRIQAYWFRGVVVGVNMQDFTQLVRVTTVLSQGSARRVNSIQRIPFGIGEELPSVQICANNDPLAVSSFDEIEQRMHQN